jgi:hypothetical protein
MRSTVDIPDVIDKKLRKRARDLGLTYREALNRALAAGLASLNPKPKNTSPYVVSAKECGFQPGIDLLHLNRLSAELEDEEHLGKR